MFDGELRHIAGKVFQLRSSVRLAVCIHHPGQSRPLILLFYSFHPLGQVLRENVVFCISLSLLFVFVFLFFYIFTHEFTLFSAIGDFLAPARPRG